jgi:sulfoxide reductase catalytic subunit YedY
MKKQNVYAVLTLAVILCLATLMPLAAFAKEQKEKEMLEPGTTDGEIIQMDPAKVDPSRLPLDTIEDLHTTGIPQEIDIKSWNLKVVHKNEGELLSLNYRQLKRMDMVTKKVLLICPGWFADYAEWEGVDLDTILNRAGVGSDYNQITFTGEDGYQRSLPRHDVENNLLILALRVNGKTLPPEHGYPVRLVAEDIYGGRWVKWVSEIEVW